MNPLSLLPLGGRVLLGVALALALVTAYNLRINAAERAGVTKTEAYYKLVLARQTAAANAALLAEQDKTRAAQDALNEFRVAQELKDAQNAKIAAAMGERLRSLLNSAGQLRDPNAGACGDPIGVPAPVETAAAAHGRVDNGAQTGGLLSAPLSGLLRQLTAEADAVNDAYASCRADALAQRAQEH